ncbi:GtrA family protein [Spirillospora sp. NPDC047279]|uniref:GtrA family protein n=1 Tax=Spirillospora sp. NPDC047279 TaxID=3155478 RepID=UPI0033D7AD4C
MRRFSGSSKRIADLVRDFSRFGLVGACALSVDLGLTYALKFYVGLGPLTSKTAATVLATLVAYFGNRHWTWRDRAHRGFSRECSLFFAFNGAGLLISLGCIGFTEYALGLHDKVSFTVANLVGLGLGTLFRFTCYSRWVFVPPTAETAPEPAARQAPSAPAAALPATAVDA